MNKYIRHHNHLILYSDNHWKTFSSIKNQSIEGQEENDRDIITKVKLRYELGDKLATIIIDEFNNIRKQFHFQTNDGYGYPFEVFAISVLHNIDYEIAYNNYIVKGSADGKIDAIYWNENKNKVYQIKIDFLDLNDIELMKKNYLEFICNENITTPNTTDLLSFCKKNKTHLTREKDFDIITISNNNSGIENIKPINIYKKYLENILINKVNNIHLTLDIPHDNGLTKLPNINAIYAYLVNAKSFIDNLLNCENINHKKENLYKLFYDNVRGNLGINKEIENTILNDPENFVKYNNGVTITGDVEYRETTMTILINDPIINNGQQTIWNLIDKYPNIDTIDLLVIVKNVNDNNIKEKISRYTNSQKLIKPIDLLSLNCSLRNLQKKLMNLTLDQNAYFLEINTSGERNYNKIMKKLYLKENIIKLADFCKLYFSSEDKQLGEWKSNISKKIEDLLKKEIEYDIEKSLMVCQTISTFNQYLKTIEDKSIRNMLRSTDISFMFIMLNYHLSAMETHQIINKINQKYFYNIPDEQRKSKLIDLYKSNQIVDMINEIITQSEINQENSNNLVSQ